MVPSTRLMSIILETEQQAETAHAGMEMKYGYVKGNLAMEMSSQDEEFRKKLKRSFNIGSIRSPGF